MDKIEKINLAIHHLKVLKSDFLKVEKCSQAAYNAHPTNSTLNKIKKLNANLNWACMNLDKQKRITWKAIVDADLETSLEDMEYHPSPFHDYKQSFK